LLARTLRARANGARGLRPRLGRREAPTNTLLERTSVPAGQPASTAAAQPLAPLNKNKISEIPWNKCE